MNKVKHKNTKSEELTDGQKRGIIKALTNEHGKGRVTFSKSYGRHMVTHDDGVEENNYAVARHEDGPRKGKLYLSHFGTSDI